jgi:uncharacterized membrane protein (DUF485 family)
MDPVPGEIDRHAVIPPEWDCLAAARQFQKLLRTKKLFIVPALLFSLAYCFALPALTGLAPQVMAAKTFGDTNLAYVSAPFRVFRSLVNRLAHSGGSIGTEALDVNR